MTTCPNPLYDEPAPCQTAEQQQILSEWILANLHVRKLPNPRHTSYGMKLLFESSEHGFYITNGQFKYAMELCGFKTADTSTPKWTYYVSERSPAFKVHAVIR